ncbi:terminase [Helicobacter pylori]|uniref:terminase n=1 Tax=Helicobacter pylori TaxID=210 RepID=UPI0009926ABC|nr:terminase [Helicobacter pylori]OOP91017.1 terminase [Helicobacter pylori]OOQ28117.1 terminase [Helicobacter pylori]PDW92506.1 terminase [Helicobacter pylori]
MTENKKVNKAYPNDFKLKVKRYYERSLESKQKIASKFGISNRTLAVWVMDGEWENKVILKEIRAMYETHGMSINALSKKYGVSVSLIRKFKIRDKWEKKKITNEAATVLKDNLTIDKMGLFLDTKKQELKENLKKSLEHLDLDPVVMEAIAETSSDELILKAMNTAYIKKQILFCAIVARGELIKMIKRAGDEVKDNISIIVAAEKVSKLFIDAGVSLFGKEQIQAVEIKGNSDYRQMNISELMALANTDDNVD